MTNDELYSHIISPPWGWFRTIVHELGHIRRTPIVGHDPELQELLSFFFRLTVMLWTVLGRAVDELFVAGFLQGDLRLRK